MKRIRLKIGKMLFHLPIYNVDGDYYAISNTWPFNHKGYVFHYRKLKQNWYGAFSYTDQWLSKNERLRNPI